MASEFVIKNGLISKGNVIVTGSVGIGVSAFNITNPEKLLVDSTGSNSINIISGYGTAGNYIQLNIKNRSSSVAASSDIVATNDTGTESGNYVDMGINSSGYTSNFVGQANDGYLYHTGSNLYIGNVTANKNLYLFAGGTTNTASITVLSNGNVGIGTITPSQKLEVLGNISASGYIISTTAGSKITGSLLGTASWATTATTANAISFVPITATSASWVSASVFITTAQTASYISSSAIFDNRVYNHTASFSTSASYSNNSTSASYGISSSYSLNTTSASFAITSAFASTPWIISASNVYYNAGNVGIGTTAPTAKFQTVGDIIVSRIADAGGVIRGDNVNGGIGGALKLGVSNTASDQFIAFGTTVSGATGEAAFTEKMRVLSSGNVGIGTTTPSQKLEVLGNISASGYIISTTAGSKITGSLLGTASNASTSSYYTANNYFCRQTPISGAINGSNYNFTWSPPPIAGTEMVFWNGVLLSSDGDYTISGGNVTLTNTRIPLTGDKLVATYFA